MASDSDGPDQMQVSQALWRNVLILIVVVGSAFSALLSIIFFMHDWTIVDLGYRHFPAIFGLPAAAAASLFVVLVTRAVSGTMKIEFFGLKFEGAASETIAWVICFLAITYAIQVTWNLVYVPPASTLIASPAPPHP